jgi:probable F420-dependent oxidoreductase
MIVSAAFPTGMEGLTYPMPFASPENIIAIAKQAERLGYHSVWGNDHMSTQRYVREEYAEPPRFWEPLVTFAFAAAETTTLRFGTGILVMPMRRDIVVLAKQIATLDHFSGGRLEIGVGVGAYREEFEALRPDDKVHRGDMAEEGVAALGKLLSDRVSTFDGTYYKFRDVELYPKTLQPKLPVYFGGNSPQHIRRLVESEIATGWIPGAPAPAALKAGIAALHEEAEKAGRDMAHLQIAPQYVAYIGETHEAAVEGFRKSQMYKHLQSLSKSTLKGQHGSIEDNNLVGTAQEVTEKALALKELGVTHLLGLFFAANDVQEFQDQMQMFAESVTPNLA